MNDPNRGNYIEGPPLSPRAAPATGPREPGDETTACADCQHQPYDHGERGCRVVQQPGQPCGCDRRRTVLDRANEISASHAAPASPPPEPAEERHCKTCGGAGTVRMKDGPTDCPGKNCSGGRIALPPAPALPRPEEPAACGCSCHGFITYNPALHCDDCVPAASAPPPRPEESAEFARGRKAGIEEAARHLRERCCGRWDVQFIASELEAYIRRHPDLRALSAPPPGEESGPMTWGVSTDEESFHGHYATKEEALAAAQSELALAPGQRFWVGGGHLYRPTRSVDVDALLDRLADDAGDACGDVAEGWPDPGTMARIALEKELHATVLRVLQRTGNLPAFYCCETTKEHTYQPALRAALREDEKGAKP
jgi:hypothetical protein